MSSGIPGLRGTDHIGFTVPDIEEATVFFRDVIGCEYVYSLGPFQSDDDWMAEHLNVHPRTIMKEIRFFRCEFGSNFEIFEYKSADPDGPRSQPRNSDIGGHHLCFYVDDIDSAISYLKEKGIVYKLLDRSFIVSEVKIRIDESEAEGLWLEKLIYFSLSFAFLQLAIAFVEP
jgi:glyoxylase I family protein